MAILTEAEFRKLFDPDRIRQLSSDYNPAYGKTIENPSVVPMVIAQAEGFVENALSRQYTTVQLEADAGIQRVVADITMHMLECRRPPISSEVKVSYETALRVIKELQEGLTKLAAVAQLLPTGPADEPTEATDSGYFD